ncbi:MAG: DUF1007 family protein [Candidatus Cloacimonetes bacterium]|nr:DUF1007 family protein [Candidatus Cloacimonadota bacterium]
MQYRTAISLAIFLLASIALFTHPHCFIDNWFEIEIDAQGMKGITVNWKFDEMFSESIIIDYDTNRNGIFEEDEAYTIYNEAFINLKNYNYFLDVKIDGRNFPVESTTDFKPSQEGVFLIYSFFVTLPVDLSTNMRLVTVMCYDPTYFIMVETNPQSGVTVSASPEVKFSTEMVEKAVEFEAFGKLPVTALTITLEKK